MQKKLIALAIAGLSGAAFAQSNVTIYGAMDATYDNVKADGATASGAANWPSRGRTTMNSSYIGFKGAEDMGNGLKAVFQIETAVGENAGASNTMPGSTYGWANRDTYVGLSGGFGTIVAGTLTGPARALGAALDVNNGATGIGANTALIGKLGGGAGASLVDNRFANAIAYVSPTFSGFNAVIATVPNENRSTDTGTGVTVDTTGWTVGLNFNQGPVMAGYAWTQLKDKGNAAPFKMSDNRLAGKYDFGMGTIGLMWDQPKMEASGASTLKQNIWYIPVTFTIGSGKIIGQYGMARKLDGAVANGYTGSDDDFKAKHFALGYEYSLSKRTILKAVYSQINNDKAARFDYLYGVSNPNSTATTAGVTAGADPRGFSIGMRHNF